MYAHTCCYLMMNFKLMKKNYFPIFHVHKNSNLNHFNSISKGANFRVLQLTTIEIKKKHKQILEHNIFLSPCILHIV